MTLAKATITVLDDLAVDEKRKLPKQFEAQFNPAEFTLQKGAQIAEVNIPGLDTPLLQYVRGQNEKLTVELFFDTTRNDRIKQADRERTDGEIKMGASVTSVCDLIEPFYQLVKIQPKTHAPPRIRFQWGSLDFKAVVESIQRKFTLFSPDGLPLRATLSVTFREYKTLEEQIKEFNLQSPDHTKRRVVQQGDTLNRIAFEEYGNALHWRTIADYNYICNPRRLIPGTELLLPPLDPFGQPLISDNEPFVYCRSGQGF